MTQVEPNEPVILHLTQGKSCLIDSDQYEEVSQFVWHVTTHGYVARKYKGACGKQKQEYLHRRLCRNPQGLFVDHINLNKLDNTMNNLRTCSQLENNHNIPGKTGKYKGVHRSRKAGRWVAQIRENGKTISLGSFSSEVEGAEAYDRAAQRIYGEFAFLNFPTPEPCTCQIALGVGA
ncbi:AP2 domain-containing protein (plasmid) [Deinococcus radiomollis]|uniref:AP2 domain-containing protein n=1 Tax=Deinococcus radiomollis TaxID=468916 RepID=UPI003891BF48